MSAQETRKETVRYRLYTLYPEQIRKLEELTRYFDVRSHSKYLRDLIDRNYEQIFAVAAIDEWP